MKKQILIFLTSLLISNFIFQKCDAQTKEDSVKAVLKLLFDGMKNADSAAIVSAFADGAYLQSAFVSKDGKTHIESDDIKQFASSICKLKKGAADEQIIVESLRTDGPLAMVWAPYKFYYEGKFSHCGVDSFQLVNVNGEWKIQYLIDTRHKTGCD